MLLAQKPVRTEIEGFLDRQRNTSFSHSETGVTHTTGSPLWDRDHNRCVIGRGDAVYDNACRAVREWKMFDLSWLELHSDRTPIVEGEAVAILISHLGFWSLNAARIVYTLDESDAKTRRYGFAYGTLRDHSECGEERFSVELDLASGDVYYDILAVSRPRHPLAYLGYPYSRYLQKCFARDSIDAMKRAVNIG